MFKNKSFVFIGRFKKKNKQTKQEFRNLVEKHGGKNVTSISNKTSYVIFPNEITNAERNNKQIRKLKNISNYSIEFVYCNWLEDCIKEKKIIPVNFEYKVEEFYKYVLSIEKIFNVNMMRKPFYKDIISNDCKIWKEFVDESGELYYYNILNGRSTNTTCNDFMDKLLGSKTILKDDYFTNEDTVLKIEKDLNENILNFRNSINMLNKYEKNLKKRLREDSENFDFRKLKRRRKKKI